ncbi:hypothetical protein LTS07_010958 [Exophiala sideris]|uniref:Uncharacterized protein n=1 Tax=Exophiala sideris TaxID=1016849 RepID=A0ABR0IVP7_9EURO|nr:hypothetical protein LTS07_010958 [Exophiala sideris]KAK5049686.1 hypothetical protein LTR69_010982 [Exophiala sideris]KAK5176667.1 hypothetical protein LTR44_010849 [Eurotiomycetes sp. CCFEE 6388]
MEPPPPPPPPHGSNPQGGGRTGGLPDGRYDIFVVPPTSAGSGFLYLPSLQTQRNSFLAGVFCTAATFFIYTAAVPVIKRWLYDTINGGGGGVFMLICGVAVVAWAFGKTQNEWAQSGPSPRAGSSSGPGGQTGGAHGGFSGAGSYPHNQSGPQPNAHSSPPPQSSWQRPPPQANTKANTTNAKSSWEKAREETRKKEEERKRAEELKKRREELEKERQKQREKDARERLERERKEKKEREEKEAAAAAAAADKQKPQKTAEASSKRPPMPTATTEREEDAYSFRPYDRPKRTHKANSAASMYSESSYAPSESTAKTTPPPSARGPYSTKDPDKIIIKGVFSFNNAFMRTPISQLVSGQGNVTDGLILRITTEGMFIDDDVRGVPQREWDIKAWTMKLAEVWCPSLPLGFNGPKRKFSLGIGAATRQESSPSQTDSNIFINKLLKVCEANCKPLQSSASTAPGSRSSFATRSTASEFTDQMSTQSCELNGMHVLRASIRDQEGKKYVFILSQSEGWKVAVGLQRLRRGSQVRALGVAGLPQNEARAILENLGFA